MKLHLKPTRQLLILLGTACALSLGLAVLVYRAQSQQRADWQAKLEAKEKEATDIEAAANQLPESERQLAAIRFAMGFLRGAEADDYQPALLDEMNAMAKQTGIKVASFSPTEGLPTQQSPIAKLSKPGVAPHSFMTINLGLEGSYRDLTRFFYRLTGLPKIVSVDTMQLQSVPTGPADRVRATVQATAYVVKEYAPETVAASALLKAVREAQEKYKAKHQGYGSLDQLNKEGLITLQEGAMQQGYLFTTDPSTGKGTFKILASTKEPKLHNLSIDQSNKIMDETDKVPYE